MEESCLRISDSEKLGNKKRYQLSLIPLFLTIDHKFLLHRRDAYAPTCIAGI